MRLEAISTTDLAICSALVLALALLNLRHSPDLAKGLVIGMVRLILQLSLIAIVLKTVFEHASLWSTVLISVVMMLLAGREVAARQQTKLAQGWTLSISIFAMTSTSTLLILLALLALVQPAPWYTPQYAIALLGMILGNTLNSVSLSMDRLVDSARLSRTAIEAQLMLGASRKAAIAPLVRQAMHSGMMPSINGMAAAGIVSLPGMMTGQILAGASPETAVRYQILIFLLIVAGAAMGAWLATRLTVWRLFDERDRLRLDRLA